MTFADVSKAINDLFNYLKKLQGFNDYGLERGLELIEAISRDL